MGHYLEVPKISEGKVRCENFEKTGERAGGTMAIFE